MVPPTPLASLSSYADRFATIIYHRQGHVLTPGPTILGLILLVAFEFLYIDNGRMDTLIDNFGRNLFYQVGA